MSFDPVAFPGATSAPGYRPLGEPTSGQFDLLLEWLLRLFISPLHRHRHRLGGHGSAHIHFLLFAHHFLFPSRMPAAPTGPPTSSPLPPLPLAGPPWCGRGRFCRVGTSVKTSRGNHLFVTTDTELSSAPVTARPPALTPTQGPGAGPTGPHPELHGSGFVLQDDPATSHSLDSLPGGRAGKRGRSHEPDGCQPASLSHKLHTHRHTHT